MSYFLTPSDRDYLDRAKKNENDKSKLDSEARVRLKRNILLQAKESRLKLREDLEKQIKENARNIAKLLKV